ncbi:hypothetical protein NHF50_06575 [Flavobacterium sp. NRK F10]|uniref:hypothetical protein n=1 Tax=Flavobacterium sp. NRK F10 TaxID=2954931 RepID=UPI002090D57D|nr:hypothetical protein [Flavobacterium sp. NRK F10]MCO6174706.1 hypothetical protein [Flavobacterium sp. NRK F10]
MNLSKNQKILIGILHFLPVIGMIAYFIFFFSFFISTIPSFENQDQENPPADVLSGFLSAFVIIIITMFVSIGVKVFDIIHLTKSNKRETGNKVLVWVLLFVFTGIIGEIVYYFLEILPEKKPEN